MSRIVVDAVGDRSLAHTKSAINTNAIHDKLHTHVVHLCRWLDAGSDQHVRRHRSVSTDFTIFADLLVAVHANSVEVRLFWLFPQTTHRVNLP